MDKSIFSKTSNLVSNLFLDDAWKKRHKLELSKSHSLDSGIDVRRRSRRKNNTTLFPSYLAKGQDRKQELLSICKFFHCNHIFS